MGFERIKITIIIREWSQKRLEIVHIMIINIKDDNDFETIGGDQSFAWRDKLM